MKKETTSPTESKRFSIFRMQVNIILWLLALIVLATVVCPLYLVIATPAKWSAIHNDIARLRCESVLKDHDWQYDGRTK
jgi:hypothetical protein